MTQELAFETEENCLEFLTSVGGAVTDDNMFLDCKVTASKL